MASASRWLRSRVLPIAFAAWSFPLALVSSPCVHAQDAVVNFDAAQTRVNFTLAATAHTVHGEFKLKSGYISFNTATGKASGSIVADAASGSSGSEGRDNKMHREVLESARFPEIVFTPTHVQGAVAPQGSSQIQVMGVMRLHGQDHPIALAFAVETAAGNQLKASTRFSVPYEKWGLKNPSNFLLRVSDTVDIDIQAVGQLKNSAP